MNIEHGECHGPQGPPTKFRERDESVLFEEGAPTHLIHVFLAVI